MSEVAFIIGDGRKTVTVAGTPEKLIDAQTACTKIEISALESNTDMVVVGSSSVVAGTANDAGGTRRGTPLSAGQTYTVYIDYVDHLYLDAVVSGEGVSFTYYY